LGSFFFVHFIPKQFVEFTHNHSFIMSSVNLENLSLQEEEGFVFDLEEGEEEVIDFRWCLVGRFLGDRPVHVNSMKVTMADIWRPVKGVKIKEATAGLFLFQFAHEMDMDAVLNGGPWSFNNQMLIIKRVQLGVQIENIPLYHVDFWVQVHNLPTGLMAERVGKTLANYIGSFVEYDKNNKGSFWREYMRIKVRVDVRQPLKKESRVKNQGGEWCTVTFKYEKLGVFCFVCGIVGHGENKCAIRFAMETDDGSRAWSKELRAEPRRRSGRQTSRWLMEDDHSRSAMEDGQTNDTGPGQRESTRQQSPTHAPNQNRPSHNQQLLAGPSCVPSVTLDRQLLNQAITIPSFPVPAVTDSAETIEANRVIISQPVNQSSTPYPHLFPTIKVPDNPLIGQSLPNNNQSIPNSNQSLISLSYSPILTETLTQQPSHQFYFNASHPSNPKPLSYPTTRTGKKNLTTKNTRTGPPLNRTVPKPDPPTPTSTLNQTSHAPMEAQAEKKRRRDNEDESVNTANLTQHFLTAGPGSQDCRDQ
jgi:14-3-3 protein epsilon